MIMQKPRTVPPPITDNIPQEMKDVDQWIVWGGPHKERNGKLVLNKTPINPVTRANAKSNDPSTWSSFDKCVNVLNSNGYDADKNDGLHGIGFQTGDDSEYVFLDFDHVLDDKENILPEAKDLLEELHTYTEISPSGDGLHCVLRVDKDKFNMDEKSYRQWPDAFGKNAGLEIISKSKYCTITGARFQAYPNRVRSRATTLLNTLIKKMSKPATPVGSAGAGAGVGNDATAFFDECRRELGTLGITIQNVVTHVGAGGDRGFKANLSACPFADEGGHEGGDTSTIYFYPDKTPGFSCFHAHCSGRNWKSLCIKIPGLPQPTYIEEFNEKYAIVDYGSDIFITDEFLDSVRGSTGFIKKPAVKFKTKMGFFNVNAHKEIQIPGSNGGTRTANAAKLWFKSPRARRYEGIAFDPSCSIPDNWYNFFRGFAVKAEDGKGGKWNLFREHVLNNICHGDEKLLHWILAWAIDPRKHPQSAPPGTAIAVHGMQGTGKTFFADTLSMIGAPYKFVASKPEHVAGHFNAHLKETIFLMAEESTFAGDKRIHNVLKSMITSDTLSIEQKGKDVITIPNYIRLIITTNHDHVIPAERGERRFLVLNISEAHAEDHPYFRKIKEQLDNGGYEQMIHDLMGMDYNREMLRYAPKTQALMEQKIISLNPLEHMIQDILDEDGLSVGADLGATWPDKVTKKDLYEVYMQYVKNLKVRDVWGRAWFCRKLYAMDIGITECPSHKIRSVQFPDREILRDKWNTYLGMAGNLPA